MWRLVEQWTGHPTLVEVAARVLNHHNVEARDELGLARAFQHFAQHAVKYFREFPERWVSPLRTIAWRIGDCDDKSILIATLLRTFRIPVRLKFLRMQLPEGKRIAHVYPQAFIKGQWIALESVRPVALGFDYETTAIERGYPYKVEYVGDSENGL